MTETCMKPFLVSSSSATGLSFLRSSTTIIFLSAGIEAIRSDTFDNGRLTACLKRPYVRNTSLNVEHFCTATVGKHFADPTAALAVGAINKNRFAFVGFNLIQPFGQLVNVNVPCAIQVTDVQAFERGGVFKLAAA